MICEKCGFEYTTDTCPVCAATEQKIASMPEKKSKLGLIGMILAIASFALKFFGIPIPELPLAIAGLTLSIIGKNQNAKDGCATAGIVVSIIKIVLEVISTISAFIFGALYALFCIVFYFLIFGSALIMG